MNLVIKFTTLFGWLAAEIAVTTTQSYKQELLKDPNAMNWSPWTGGFFFVVALIFV